MPPLVTRSRPMRLRLRFAALVLSALALGGASRGYAQTSASTGGSAATVSTPAPACSSDSERSSPQSAQDILDHAGLINDEQVTGERMLYVRRKPPCVGRSPAGDGWSCLRARDLVGGAEANTANAYAS